MDMMNQGQMQQMQEQMAMHRFQVIQQEMKEVMASMEPIQVEEEISDLLVDPELPYDIFTHHQGSTRIERWEHGITVFFRTRFSEGIVIARGGVEQTLDVHCFVNMVVDSASDAFDRISENLKDWKAKVAEDYMAEFQRRDNEMFSSLKMEDGVSRQRK